MQSSEFPFRGQLSFNMQSRQHTFLKVAAIIALYWTVSISMVFVNKHLLSGSYGDMDLSIFVAWYQSLAAIAFIQFIGLFQKLRKKALQIPDVDTQALFQKDMLKISLTCVIMIVMNNLMLKHIGVAFYQVARSFTLVFTIVLSASMLKQPLTWKVSLACLFIVIGYVIGIDEENNIGTLSIWGIIYGLLASLSAAICGIYTKRFGSAPNIDSLKQAYYNSINSCLFLSPLVYSTGQAGQVLESNELTSVKFWVFLTVSGALSLAVAWVSTLQIRVTSPVTHHISITGRSVAQTIIAILYYKEQKTMWWWCGNLSVVSGVLLYAWLKSYKLNPPKDKSVFIYKT